MTKDGRGERREIRDFAQTIKIVQTCHLHSYSLATLLFFFSIPAFNLEKFHILGIGAVICTWQMGSLSLSVNVYNEKAEVL